MNLVLKDVKENESKKGCKKSLRDPWQNPDCGSIPYYPELILEVTKVTENADGTVTLLVNVLCPDKHTDHLFEHEVTMKTETDGSFQYLANRIVWRGENELPSPQSQMEVQPNG